jgi:hypothetical protein
MTTEIRNFKGFLVLITWVEGNEVKFIVEPRHARMAAQALREAANKLEARPL